MQIKTSTKKLITASVLASTLLLSQSANAGLIARTITDATFGNVEAYYDDVLDITWLKDANFAKTSGYDADGKMTWADANAWAGQLQIGTFDDWRLTSVQPQNGSTFDYNGSYDGSSDEGHNITSSMHEMAYMFHVNLGLEGFCDGANNTANNCDSSGTGFHNTALDTAIDTVNLGNHIAVDNLMSYVYRDDVEYAPNTFYAPAFNADNGFQYYHYKVVSLYGWAVRSGDVSQVPEPTSIVLFALSLVGLAVRRKANISQMKA
ncbi:MAG: PEP-CTERM sorting domain-containing protein [Colwellia sp.]|nr:PEP-CTERM sorting domain-containing protein [Colwellia sp.]